MAKQKQNPESVEDILARTAKEERRLLKRERQAEAEVAELRQALEAAQDRLAKAEARVATRTKELDEAETRLRMQRDARLDGPPAPAADSGPDNGRVRASEAKATGSKAAPAAVAQPESPPAKAPRAEAAPTGTGASKARAPKPKAPAPAPSSRTGE